MVDPGLVVVDKSPGMTSHDVVARVRRLAGTRKVGHAGTLDPMATGVLVLGVGRATRLLGHLQLADKEYEATIRLGESTTTDDAEGETVATADASKLTAEQIRAAVLPLTGEIEQVPTDVSAIKVGGKRAYALAREGVEVELKERAVTVSAFDVLEIRREVLVGGIAVVDVDVRVECSSGTYIRALARDLGAALGVGGHLTALRRTRIGPFSIGDARPVDDAPGLIPPQDAAARLFPTLTLDPAQHADLANGKRVALDSPDTPGPVAALAPDGSLIGLVAIVGGRARVLVNFPTQTESSDIP